MSRRNAQPRNRREAEAKERALEALGLMRRKNLTIREAAKEAGTKPSTVVRYVGSALPRTGQRGRREATKFDRIKRSMNFPTATGDVVVTFTNSRVASMIAEYANALRSYRRGRDLSVLDPFKGKSFRAGGVTYEFMTDRETVRRISEAGLFAAEGLYRIIQEK